MINQTLYRLKSRCNLLLITYTRIPGLDLIIFMNSFLLYYNCNYDDYLIKLKENIKPKHIKDYISD